MIKFIKPCSIGRIVFNNVSKSFVEGDNQVKVIENLSYIFEKGRTYALMGASGTGKSTLLHLLAGFEQPSVGTILYDDTDLACCTKKQKQQFLRYSLGVLFQNAYLLGELSVLENVMIKGLYDGRSQELCQKEAVLVLETVGLHDKINALPHQLSGGQQQRAALARALFGQPDFILADEPTGNLDEVTGARVIDMLCENQKKFGMGMIVSTHDNAVAQKMDVVLELRNGKLFQRI